MEGQGPKQGRSHSSDWIHWDGLWAEGWGKSGAWGWLRDSSVLRSWIQVTVDPHPGLPLPAGTCHYKPPRQSCGGQGVVLQPGLPGGAP